MWPFPVVRGDGKGEIRWTSSRGRSVAWPTRRTRQLQRTALGRLLRGPLSGSLLLAGAWSLTPVPNGSIDRVSDRRVSTIVFDASGVARASASKEMLVPMVERLPFESSTLAAATRRLTGVAPGIVPGDRRGPLESVASLPALGTAVCWENVFERVFRLQARTGAQAFVVGSNEMDLGLGAEMDHMLASTRWRARETGRAVLRATNNGPTVLVDAAGDVRASLARDRPGVLRIQLPLVRRHAATPYLAWGWLLQPILAVLGFLLALVPGYFPRRLAGGGIRRRTGPHERETEDGSQI